MAFPTTTHTNNQNAASDFVARSMGAGLDLSGLSPIGQIQSALANLFQGDPTTVTIGAGDIASGTFGANNTPADTGTYVFPGQVTFTTKAVSSTALATPAALVATASNAFASTVSGATLMGYGTTGDVTLKNRAGTDVLVVTSNTLNVTMAGALAVAGAVSGVTTLAMTAGLSGVTTIAMGGALSGVTSLAFSTSVSSTTALATPSAYVATTATMFASTVSGASLMGFGSTNDVTLMNQAGTVVLGITANTTGVTMAGALAITGALSGVTTAAFSTSATVTSASAVALAVGLAGATNPSFVVSNATASQAAGLKVTGATSAGNVAVAVISSGAAANLLIDALGVGTIGIGSVSTGIVTITPATTITGAVIINNTVQLGTAAGANLITIGGSGYGAGVASVRLNGLTTAAVTNQTATLLNAPVSGNASFWMPVSIAGTIRYIPCW